MENTAPAPANTAPNHPKFVRWAVVLGIIIVLNIFFVVLRSLVLPAPDITAYCPNTNVPAPENAQACDALGGVWTEYGAPAPTANADGTPTGYCDMYAGCQPAYQAAQSKYELYGFVIMLALGIISVIAGVVPMGSSIVSTGLAYGGVVSFIIGSASYWGEAGNWVRLAISLVALIALLYIGYKRFKD